MNRAKRYSGLTLAITAVLSLCAGLWLAWPVARPPEPDVFQITKPAGQAHATASITAVPVTRADSALRAVAHRTSCVPTRPGVITYGEVESCILAYLLRLENLVALQGTTYNRDSKPGTVTPPHFSLHPGKTPLVDPTQDAYYKKLLQEGRFPTSGSSEGRPR